MGPSIFLILPTPRYLDDEWTFIPTCRVNSHGGFQSYLLDFKDLVCHMAYNRVHNPMWHVLVWEQQYKGMFIF